MEDQKTSRDHAPTDSRFGPWRVWFDPPPIGTRDCDWHYQHEDADGESPGWMYGHCASRDDCFAEIIDGYEDRAEVVPRKAERPFWVLEDPRCEAWSPTPQYLHKGAKFYQQPPHNWAPNWCDNLLQTPNIQEAMRFATKGEAEDFKANHGPDARLNLWEAREHVMCALRDGASSRPPVTSDAVPGRPK